MLNRRIRNMIGIVFMAAAMAFSIIQLNVTVVRADGCPSDPAGLWNCGGCYLVDQTSYEMDGVIYRHCFYNCWGCPGPGGDPMEIEHDMTVHD